ncbi:MAG: 50S ribosomal protein L3 N(5)-glutamine methyltransferase [Chromatiaceae bacterium]|nr:MAG: 50S ribosomal protein L3 N(5)-glutamine methyltransferase [Chromatiaceae bacterium]
MSAETDALFSIEDFIRWGASRFSAAGLYFGHGTDNPGDEAAWLVAHALHLPPTRLADYRTCRVTDRERGAIAELLARRITERRPAAYLTGQTWFAGLPFLVDEQVMVPRSPLAELIVNGFVPWLAPAHIGRVLDLCTGSGCIGIATAVHLPVAAVDLADISPAALRVAERNRALHAAEHALEERVRIIQSDLFAGLDEQSYDLIVSNPPYVSAAEIDAFPAEYRHEPRLAFAAGVSGLDLVLRILRDAPDFLDEAGVLICEVGNSAAALIQRFPDVPFTWLEFEHGGDGVFLLHQPELVEWHPLFAAAVAALD